jgi:hypothetical protein
MGECFLYYIFDQQNLSLNMTIVKKNIVRVVKDIALSNTLFVALCGGFIACSSNNNADGSYDTEEAEVYTKGIKTYINEVSKGEFKIIDEREVPIDSSIAIVTYLNGKKDTLNPALAKKLIDNDLNNGHYNRHHSSLSNVLLHGGMGYMFARMMGNNNNQYHNYRSQEEKENKNGNAGFYVSPKVYENARNIHENVSHSKVTITRPSGSRSGFFRGSVHSSHIG